MGEGRRRVLGRTKFMAVRRATCSASRGVAAAGPKDTWRHDEARFGWRAVGSPHPHDSATASDPSTFQAGVSCNGRPASLEAGAQGAGGRGRTGRAARDGEACRARLLIDQRARREGGGGGREAAATAVGSAQGWRERRVGGVRVYAVIYTYQQKEGRRAEAAAQRPAPARLVLLALRLVVGAAMAGDSAATGCEGAVNRVRGGALARGARRIAGRGRAARCARGGQLQVSRRRLNARAPAAAISATAASAGGSPPPPARRGSVAGGGPRPGGMQLAGRSSSRSSPSLDASTPEVGTLRNDAPPPCLG